MIPEAEMHTARRAAEAILALIQEVSKELAELERDHPELAGEVAVALSPFIDELAGIVQGTAA